MCIFRQPTTYERLLALDQQRWRTQGITRNPLWWHLGRTCRWGRRRSSSLSCKHRGETMNKGHMTIFSNIHYIMYTILWDSNIIYIYIYIIIYHCQDISCRDCKNKPMNINGQSETPYSPTDHWWTYVMSNKKDPSIHIAGLLYGNVQFQMFWISPYIRLWPT